MKILNSKLSSIKITYFLEVKDRDIALKIIDTAEGTLYDNAEIKLARKTSCFYNRIEYSFNMPTFDLSRSQDLPRRHALTRNKFMRRIAPWKKEIGYIREKIIISQKEIKFNIK